MTYRARVLAETGCELGEGPLWRPDEQALIFVDIIGRALLRWTVDHGAQRIDLGRRLTALAPIAGETNAYLALIERRLHRVAPDFAAAALHGQAMDGTDTAMADLAPEHTLLNDGCADAAGRMVFGSKSLDETRAVGRMASYHNGRVTSLRRDLVIFNGPAFSPAGDRVYYADSPTKKIFTAAYDLESGEMGASELFVELGPDDGYPDGMTTDLDGGLWNAHWDGARVTRYRPDGGVDRVVETPASRPTSVAFGGPEMKTLFITSARRGTDAMAPAPEPMAGALMAFDADVAGAPSPAVAVR